MAINETADIKPVRERVLDPVSRMSEILFGLLMVLTFTGTFSVANAGESSVRELLIASLGCNLAWGLIDGCMLLLNRLAERGHTWRLLRQLKTLPLGSPQAFALLADAMPVLVGRVMRTEDVQTLHQRVLEQPVAHTSLKPDWSDLLAALAVFLLVVLSTLPVVLPFVLLEAPLYALRASNAIALLMLFLIGLGYGRFAGARSPGITALMFTLLGVALVFATIALGG
ncbi:VIT family protein [Pseudomonas flexibilis]|nr:VIT family protein [Pseudomonas flexibilis]